MEHTEMNTRVMINLREGIIEAEGEEMFVSSQIEKFAELLERSKAKKFVEEKNRDSDTFADEVLEEHAEPSAKSAKKRRKGANPPKGTSCRARILEIKKEGFFKEQRSPSDIVTGLKAKGWTHALNQVGAALTQMFAKSEIQRTGADGTFKYFWDRD